MCQQPSAPEVDNQALCYFRFFVYREYREMRFLGNPRIGRYDKFSDRYSEILKLDRSSFARLWYQIASETDPAQIMKPFEELTGLRLQEVEEALRHGEWHPVTRETKIFGGPKHAEIALHTLRLGDAIGERRWTDLVPQELAILKDVQHNCPRPSRHEYRSLLEDLASLNLPTPACCLLDPD